MLEECSAVHRFLQEMEAPRINSSFEWRVSIALRPKAVKVIWVLTKIFMVLWLNSLL